MTKACESSCKQGNKRHVSLLYSLLFHITRLHYSLRIERFLSLHHSLFAHPPSPLIYQLRRNRGGPLGVSHWPPIGPSPRGLGSSFLGCLAPCSQPNYSCAPYFVPKCLMPSCSYTRIYTFFDCLTVDVAHETSGFLRCQSSYGVFDERDVVEQRFQM
jgi:hypothetical protein